MASTGDEGRFFSDIFGELITSFEPEVSEWGNPAG